MVQRYTIGQTARMVGVPTSTLRYYERAGLLRPTGRTAHNYRYYAEEVLERLRFIRAAQGSGFTLDDISHLLSLGQDAAPPCEEVQGIIEERVRDVERRIRDLKHLRGVLRSSLQSCLSGKSSGMCYVINTLRHASASGSARSPARGDRPRGQNK
jgi:MerR family mercuric resistance operon transcriptional regulator